MSLHYINLPNLGIPTNTCTILGIFFKNGRCLASFSFIFLSFQPFFTTNKCEKCPHRIRCWDLNPQPLESQVTIRPGLPPYLGIFYQYTIHVRNVTQPVVVAPFFRFFSRCFRLPMRLARSGEHHSATRLD